MENTNGALKVVGALAAGALVGVILGILFAPEKGSRTRSNIIDGVKDLADDVKNKVSNEASALHKKAKDLEDMAKEKVEEVFENEKHKAKEAAQNS
jgi:gas vesicle protein